jgi:uncharacterized membrane protein YidH (DUF202 family)
MPKRTSGRRRRESTQLLLAKEQVVLSKERTILSFMSTALTLIALGIVIVNILHELIYQAIGFGLIFTGFVELITALRKFRNKQKIIASIEKKTKI